MKYCPNCGYHLEPHQDLDKPENPVLDVQDGEFYTLEEFNAEIIRRLKELTGNDKQDPGKKPGPKPKKHKNLDRKVYGLITKAGYAGISRTELFRGFSKLNAAERDSVISSIKQLYGVEEREEKGNGQGARPRIVYFDPRTKPVGDRIVYGIDKTFSRDQR